MTEDKCSFFIIDIIEVIRWLPTTTNRQDYAVVFKEQTAYIFTVGSSMY
jgi:hypothetical protein